MREPVVVQSESSDGLIDRAIWWFDQIGVSWYVPGDFRGEFTFRLYRIGTTKIQGMMENKSRNIRS